MPLSLRKDINIWLFFPCSLSATGLFCLLAHSFLEVGVVVFVYGATLLSLYITHFVIKRMVSRDVRGGWGFDKSKIMLYSLGKIVILFGAVGFGAVFMKERIIIAVLNHVAQIFILGICFVEVEPRQ